MAGDLSQFYNRASRFSMRRVTRESNAAAQTKPEPNSESSIGQADKEDDTDAPKQVIGKRKRGNNNSSLQKRPKTSKTAALPQVHLRTPPPRRAQRASAPNSSPLSSPPSSTGLDGVSRSLNDPFSANAIEELNVNDLAGEDVSENGLFNVATGALPNAKSIEDAPAHLPTPSTDDPEEAGDHDTAMVETPGSMTQEDSQSAEHFIDKPDSSDEILGDHASPPGPHQNATILAPSTPESNENPQLPTPSSRPTRTKKPPNRYGNLANTTDVVSKEVEMQDELNEKMYLNDANAGNDAAKKKSAIRKKPSRMSKTTSQPATSKGKAASSQNPTEDEIEVTPAKKRQFPRKTAASKALGTATKRTGVMINVTRKSLNAPSVSPKNPRGRPSKGVQPRQQNDAVIPTSLVVKLPLSILPPSPDPVDPALAVDPAKLALSRKLAARQPLDSKPQPQGTPEVWAESRQALCETLPYFKKPQGGCYQNDGHVYGFLFDSVGHCREYMDENLIICRAGGSMESDSDGVMVQKKDQTFKEAQVQAVLNDIAHHNPVVVICGDRNEKAPCKMPHLYCVLGWYKPVLVWSEKTAGKGKKVWTTVKYRLERLNRHRPAWHAPTSSEGSTISQEDRDTAGELLHKTCDHCRERYPQVYLRDWMCLNAECTEFWKINGFDAPFGSEGMDYSPAFLFHESESWKGDETGDGPEPAPLRPPIPNIGNTIGDNLTRINTRGICCPQCGRCSSRRFFKGWYCENEACDYKLLPDLKPVLPAMLHTPWDIAPTLIRNRKASGVDLKVEHRRGYKISTYTVEGVDGRFIHAAPTKDIIQDSDGPDQMFAEMQTADMGLERRTFAVKKASGAKDGATQDQDPAVSTTAGASQELPETAELVPDSQQESEKKPEFADGDLMTAFSMNYGMPYKFVASGASQPFEHAPKAVVNARDRLNWAAKEFLGKEEDPLPFNEQLIFAYLEGQKIEYHDDGEEGLGPCIATLSLGGRAKMHLRMKMKHHTGCSKTGIYTEERPVPGGLQYEERLAAWEELQALKDNDSVAYNKRRKEIPKELGIFEKRMKKADDLLTVTLSHGDIVIMDGYDIQKYLEHKVVPEDYLRFALTCRRVLENHLKPDELPAYSVEDAVQSYEGPVLLNEGYG